MSVFRCPTCNERVKVANSQCPKCKAYIRHKEQTIHRPNKKEGEQPFDYKGRPICKICGKAFDNLGNHIYPNHGITVREYKIKFDLPISMSLSSKERFKKLSARPLNSGVFKKGCNHQGVGRGTPKQLTKQQRLERSEAVSRLLNPKKCL